MLCFLTSLILRTLTTIVNQKNGLLLRFTYIFVKKYEAISSVYAKNGEPTMEHRLEVGDPTEIQLVALRQRIDEMSELNAQLDLENGKLKESQSKYEAVVQAFEGFIYICSSDYEIEFMNERLIERTGRNAVGEKCHQALHDLDHVCQWCANERVFQGETVRCEAFSPQDNRWYYVVNTPLRRKDGSISKMAMIQDITERKLSEEKAQQQSEFINHVLESLPHPFYIIDAHDYRIVMANSAARLSLSGEKTTCYALTHRLMEPCNTLEHPCPMDEVKNTNQPVTVEHVHYDRDGNSRNIEVHAYPVFDAAGDVATILEYALDITDRKSVEAEKEKLIRRLKTANEDLKMSGFAVSHDLRSPLITMRGLLSWIERDAISGNSDRLKKNIRLVDSAAAKMEHLLDKIKVLSTAGYLKIVLEEVSLEQIVRETLELLDGRITDSGTDIKISTNLPYVHGDHDALLQVFQNLIENAIKFRRRQGQPRVEIGIRRDNGNEPVVYVRDNGIGIDFDNHRKIFGLFQLLDKDSDGTGFGLALVKRIIEAHGGDVWVESPGIGHGSTFCFTLPAMRPKQDSNS